MALPFRARLSFPHSQSLPSGSLHRPFILIHQEGSQNENHNHSSWSSELNSSIPIHFSSLIPKRLMLILAIPYLTTSNLPWFTDLTFQVRLWLSLFILSGAISPLFSSSLLYTYQSGGFIFQCLIFLSFHTIHGVCKARTLKWFAIPFSNGPHFVKTFYHDSSVLGGPTLPGL